MYYFKFSIPQNADGSRVTYSPGWHGVMSRCPKAVTVLLYNDKEGYGIARTEDSFVPKEVTVLKEADILAQISAIKDEPQVYFGEKLTDRWNPEAEIKEMPVESTEPMLESAAPTTKKTAFCPICHKFIMWLPDNIIAKTIQLVCPDGHKVVLHG